MRKLMVAVLLAMCSAVPVAAHANDGAVGTQGGTVVLVSNDAVRMDSESVQIICLNGYALYRIDFKFVNESGSDQKVKLGFPFPDYENREEANTGEAPGGFRAWLDGRELAVKQERGRDTYPDGTPNEVIWFTHTAVFPPGESMITVHYAGAPDVSVAVPDLLKGTGFRAEDGYSLGFYPYHVHTGAGWAGKIGLSVIRYTLARDFNGEEVDQVTKNLATQDWVTPARRKNLLAFTQPTADSFQWVYSDYEPTHAHDPEIAFATRWDESAWVEPSASSELRLGEYEYPSWSAGDGSPGSAWAEAVDGPGIGEWVKLGLGKAMTVREIRVFPGYQKRADLFKKYNRPRKLQVQFDDGTSEVLTLQDEMGMQTFPVKARSRTAKVTILDVYPGTNARDETYLSEISFASSPAPLFDTFQSLTGIAPAEGFKEPAALAARTRGTGTPSSGSVAIGGAVAATASAVGTSAPSTGLVGVGGGSAGTDGSGLLLLLGALAMAGVIGWVVVSSRRPADPHPSQGEQGPIPYE